MGFHRHIVLTTNAPAHWPTIEIVQRPGLPGLAPRLHLAFEQNGLPARLGRVTERLFPGGVLKLFEVEEYRKRYGVFGYEEATPEASSHYEGARRLLAQREIEAIWYCPHSLANAEPSDPLGPLELEMLYRVGRSKLRGKRFATWWPAADGSKFSDSAARDALQRAFAALDGIEELFFAVLARELELPPFDRTILNKKTRRESLGPRKLPRRERLVPMVGPEDRLMVLRAGAEKGLLIAFPTKVTPKEYRDNFLAAFANCCESFHNDAERRAASGAPRPNGSPLSWWRLLVSTIEAQEQETGSGVTVGLIEIDD